MTLAMRSLYDLDYIESNCTLPYDESTEIDTLLSTAVSNYVIGFIAIVVAGYLWWKQKHQKTTRSDSNDFLMIGYMILNALGYTLAGVYHQVIDDTDDVGGKAMFYLSVALTVLALPCLEFTLSESKWLRIGSLITNGIILIMLVVFQQLFFTAVWLCLSFFLIGGLYLWQGARRQGRQFWLAGLACLLIASGFAVVGFFNSTCGGPAQKDCFRDCIFPDPTKFNHNGLFHILVALGLLLQGLAEAVAVPSNDVNNNYNKGESDKDNDEEKQGAPEDTVDGSGQQEQPQQQQQSASVY